MRPGIVTYNPFLQLLFASGQVPMPLLEVFWSMGMSRSIIAGVRLGIFDVLALDAKDAATIANSINGDPNSVKVLLDALTGFGYLHRKAGLYSLTSKSRKWLQSTTSNSLVEGIRFIGDLFQGIEPIETAILTGKVDNFHHKTNSPDFWRDYMRGLAKIASLVSEQVIRRIPVSNAEPKRLLDVGGGHGMFSVAFCRRYPTAQAEILDLPEVLPHGQALVKEAGYAERIQYRSGDLRTIEWGDNFDVVFLFNILHNLSAAECATAISKAHTALRPSGRIVILDSQHEGGQDQLSALAGFNELFFFLVSGSQAWPEATIRDWLQSSNFQNCKRGTTIPLPGLLMLTAQNS